MSAYYESAYYDYVTPTVSGRWYTITVSNSTTGTNVVMHSDGVMSYNWQHYEPEEPPAPPPEYLELRPVVLYRECRRAQLGAGRIMAPPPRNKLRRWKSLKEKRASWGIA